MVKATKAVKFDAIHIYMFNQRLGDNPFVSKGVPIALGTQVIQETILSLDLYEWERGPRRSRQQLILSRTARTGLLLLEGYTHQDIAMATRRAQDARKAIIESYQNKQWDRFHEKVEATTRIFTKVVGVGRRTKKQDSLNSSWTSLEQLNRGNQVVSTDASDTIDTTEQPLQLPERGGSSKAESLKQDHGKLESLNRGLPTGVRQLQRSASTA